MAYEPAPEQRLTLTGLYSRSADDEATEIDGFHEEKGAELHETRLAFASRALVFGQLRGSHAIAAAGDATLAWALSLGRAGRYEPDTRGTVYTLDPAFGYAFESDAASGSHFYSDQHEQSYGGQLDWTQPLGGGDAPSRLKAGMLFDLRERVFDARRFRFRPMPGSPPLSLVCPTTSWDATCPDQLFTSANIGSLLELEENTRSSDGYAAGLRVVAGYVMADLALAPGLRLLVGQRLEASRQTIRSFDPFTPDVTVAESDLASTDWLPAASLLWNALPNANLRASVTRTVARPQLRELAPFAFSDYYGGREVQGNPDLALTRVVNADLRFEWFPTLREVAAVSVFYKHLRDPIEEVIQAAGARGIVTFANAEAARLLGLELELRKSFGFVIPELAPLSLVSNLTLVHSEVALGAGESAFVTHTSRPLANQAPFVVNVALDWSDDDRGTRARLAYNVAGRSIAQVGTQGLPDVYEQPRHELDLALTQRVVEGLDLRVSATNLALAQVERTQGPVPSEDNVISRYRTGATFSIGAGYTY
ncbi:MAG: TonB-dependent receptor [Myxococcales bacterium]|nr:TonB-dependent receptor [Myxococcales bacterium]